MTRVLIIGGAGFIGSHLARHCIARGAEVHIVARPETELWRLEGILAKLTLHRLDLHDRSTLDRCFAKARPDEVYYLGYPAPLATSTRLFRCPSKHQYRSSQPHDRFRGGRIGHTPAPGHGKSRFACRVWQWPRTECGGPTENPQRLCDRTGYLYPLRPNAAIAFAICSSHGTPGAYLRPHPKR